MKRTTLNLILDTMSFLNLLLLATTGSIMRWVLPPGSGGGQGRGFRGGRGPAVETQDLASLLGLGRHDWGDVHFVLAIVFLTLILIHILLHWTWIKTCTKSVLLPSRATPCDRADGSG
jgi:hypothetical protein